MSEAERIEIESITTPGHIQRVDRAKYMAMRTALLRALPRQPPGMTVAQAKQALLPHLPASLFPQGATAGWWLKAVQLDLEAKGVVERLPGTPLRLFKHVPAGRSALRRQLQPVLAAQPVHRHP